MRIATFNLENLDTESFPSLESRIAIMRPQLERINADIICFQEIHSNDLSDGTRVLGAFDQLVANTQYENYHRSTTSTTSGQLYHERNLVTLSRFPIIDSTQIRDSSGPRPSYQMVTADPPDTEANVIKWERPLLVTQISWNELTIHVINVHMKSKIASSIPGQKVNNFTWKTVSAWAEGSFISSMKRVGQSLQARMAIDEIFDTEGIDAHIIICGDFNADVHEVPVRAIIGSVEETGNPDHSPRIMIPCENNIPEPSRYSLLHLGRGEMLDHILASRCMLRFFSHAEIHNESLPDESGAFRTDDKFPESDHAPVIASFRDSEVTA